MNTVVKIQPKDVDGISFQEASFDIWDKKYRLTAKDGSPIDKSMDDTYKRVARALADVETEDLREQWYESFLWALRHGAIPAGRVTSNAGALEHKPATSTINCTVSGTIRDSMDDILNKVHEAGLTLKAGCGIGYEFSTLRPRAPTRRALCRSWISTTRCVSPCRRPAAGAVPRWERSTSVIPTRWSSFAQNARTDVCGNSIYRCSSRMNS
jgi:hypothetical protein